MPPIDPHQLLKALSSLLTQNGGIKGPTETIRIYSLMKDANKLASKCVYINILRATDAQETLEKFIDIGGWEILNTWLEDSKESENTPVLVEILKVYQQLPITVELLKKNSAAKSIKQLRKSEDERLKTLSSDIVEKWMNKIRSKSDNTESNDKSKKKKNKDKTKDEEKSNKHKHHHHHHHHSPNKEDKSESSHRISDMDTDSIEDITTGTGVVTPGNGLKIHIKLERKDNSDNKKDPDKKRPSTVKRPPVKFRSTGLEENPIISKKKTLSNETKTQPKRAGTDQKPKEEPPEKKSRLHISTTLSSTTSSSSPVSSSPTVVSPAELHGRIKIIPAKPKPVHEIHESNSFINDITRMPERPVGSIRRKKRGSVNGTGPPTGKPPTPTSPVSPTTALKNTLPSVPSFYRDTLETNDNKDVSSPTEKRTPSPTDDKTEAEDAKTNGEIKMETEENTETSQTREGEDGEKEEDEESLSSADGGTKGLLTTGKKKKKRKNVSWAEEAKLRQYHYFEMDETERENVNRPKDFNTMKKQEMMMDKRAMETARRLINDNMQEAIPWRRPPLIDNLMNNVDRGSQSLEKNIQREREGAVLQAIFFSKDMLPDGPSEPDIENVEPADPKFIPLEDEGSGGGEDNLFAYDHHPPVHQPPPLSQPQFELPPDVANMLASFQHQASQSQTPLDTNNPIIANVQNLLQSLMGGGNNNPSQTGEALEKLKSALQPLQNQGMLGPPLGMQMGPGVPQGMPPRAGLLGNAPPGFNMGMGGPCGPHGPNFPPPGPGMGPGPRMGPGQGPGQGPHQGHGDHDDWGENMVGGPPPMRGGRGRPGIPMRGGRMPGPNQGPPPGEFGPRGPRPMGPRGPPRGSRGGRRGSERSVCRHFAGGGCRRGEMCSFLHPGVNGPPV